MNNIAQHILYDKLLVEFNPTLNLDKKLSDFTFGSKKKVWWKCDASDDHEWVASVQERFNGTNCPCCAGLKAVKSNCLETTHPEIAKEWHPTKNGDLTPQDVTQGSGKVVWWKCGVSDDHEWQDTVNHRTGYSKRGCPCCSGKKIVESNCLALTHPELSSQWHSAKNKDLTPFDLTFGSSKEVWWQCDKFDSHTWKATPNRRTSRNSGCPFCKESHGEIKIRTFLEKNNIEFESQKSFKDCKLKQALLFDFYIPVHNMCIEFDGQQHFESVNIFGGKENFQKTQERDTIKNEFCKKENISLLRIPYTEFNDIDNILTKTLF